MLLEVGLFTRVYSSRFDLLRAGAAWASLNPSAAEHTPKPIAQVLEDNPRTLDRYRPLHVTEFHPDFCVNLETKILKS